MVSVLGWRSVIIASLKIGSGIRFIKSPNTVHMLIKQNTHRDNVSDMVSYPGILTYFNKHERKNNIFAAHGWSTGFKCSPFK